MEAQPILNNFIDKITFDNWTNTWKNIALRNDEPYTCFYLQGDNTTLQTKSYFIRSNIINFLSNIGITTVKVRFGIDKNNVFQIILYGVDDKNQEVTPYYYAQPYYENLLKDIDDPLITPLVDTWTKNWRQTGGMVYKRMFKVYIDEILEGYNYPFREILDAFQPALSIPDSGIVNVIFVLHQYPRYTADGETVYRNTFGIVFHAAPGLQSGAEKLTDNQPDPYFDVTTPCPQTC